MRRWSRREMLRALGVGATAAGAAAVAPKAFAAGEHVHGAGRAMRTMSHGGNMAVGDVDLTAFDPSAFLTAFDYGKVSTLPDGRTLREYELVGVDKEIEVAPGVMFPAWTYNGQVPGPTLRATEGDRMRVRFRNAGAHPHTIHFHGIHQANMDGVFEIVQAGGEYVYEFDAEPFGLHLYHCHTVPLRKHFHKGLYGVFIVDPKQGRPPARELVLVMNGFDTNLDGGNEVYAVNSVAFHYMRHPIRLKVDEPVRVYLVNATEFDPINSMHIHANFFNEFRTGTRLEPNNFTDVTVLAQAERAILEFSYRYPGRYMFHAHQTEFTELGWTGLFEVVQ